MSSLLYAVVEFIGKDEVGVVPMPWLEKSKKEVYCFWPPFNHSSKAKRGELPDKDIWNKFKVRIFTESESYSNALLKAKKAELTSHVETDDEPMRRTVKKPLRYESDSADDEEDVDSSGPEKKRKREEFRPLMPKPPSYQRSTKSPQGLRRSPRKSCRQLMEGGSSGTPMSDASPQYLDGPNPSTSDQRSTKSPQGLRRSPRKSCRQLMEGGSSGTPISDASPQSLDGPNPSTSASLPPRFSPPTRSSDTITSPNDNFQRNMLMKMEHLTEMIGEIRSTLWRVVASLGTPVESLDDVVDRPCNSVEELQSLCDRLEADDSFRKRMVFYLSSLGGATDGESVRRMMRQLGTNKLWAMYSLKGRKGKLCLENLPVRKLIFQARSRTDRGTKACDEDAAIGDTLRYAPHRGKKVQTQPEDVAE